MQDSSIGNGTGDAAASLPALKPQELDPNGASQLEFSLSPSWPPFSEVEFPQQAVLPGGGGLPPSASRPPLPPAPSPSPSNVPLGHLLANPGQLQSQAPINPLPNSSQLHHPEGSMAAAMESSHRDPSNPASNIRVSMFAHHPGNLPIPPVYYPQPTYPAPAGATQIRATGLAPASLTVMHPNLVETLKTAIDLPTDSGQVKPGRPTAFHAPVRWNDTSATGVMPSVLPNAPSVGSEASKMSARVSSQHPPPAPSQSKIAIGGSLSLEQLLADDDNNMSQQQLVPSIASDEHARLSQQQHATLSQHPVLSMPPPSSLVRRCHDVAEAGGMRMTLEGQVVKAEGNGGLDMEMKSRGLSVCRGFKEEVVDHHGSLVLASPGRFGGGGALMMMEEGSKMMAGAPVVPVVLIEERRPFMCDFFGCQRTFRNLQTLRMHSKTHTPITAGGPGAGPYSRRQELRPVHGDLKAGRNKKIPSCCPVCNETFVGLYELRRHFGRKHSNGEKQFKCGKCGKAFFIDVDLRDHEKACGEPIQCAGCGLHFSFKCNLVGHRKAHPECRDREKSLASANPSTRSRRQRDAATALGLGPPGGSSLVDLTEPEGVARVGSAGSSSFGGPSQASSESVLAELQAHLKAETLRGANGFLDVGGGGMASFVGGGEGGSSGRRAGGGEDMGGGLLALGGKIGCEDLHLAEGNGAHVVAGHDGLPNLGACVHSGVQALQSQLAMADVDLAFDHATASHTHVLHAEAESGGRVCIPLPNFASSASEADSIADSVLDLPN